MSQLNTQQQLAVDTITGPILILAGAGSGKTKVLTHKIAHLVEHGHAGTDEILAVTFTNKAAAEMKERIAKLLKNNQRLPWVGTFHSICLKILKRHADTLGFDRSFTIYDTSDQLARIREIMKRLDIDTKMFKPKALLSMISSAKNEMLDPDDYKKYATGLYQGMAAKIYPLYQKALKSNNAMDFDDLIMNTVKLFIGYEDILTRYQNQFKFILIDEYQDTNHSQYKLTSLLSKKRKNICVVGDDAQSIYSFRGATIENILNFEKDYPEAVIIKLEQNYRSTKTILEAANEIISKNINQKQKRLWTDNNDGDKISIFQGYNESEESSWIADKIKALVDNKLPASEICILYRTNAQSRNLEEAMLMSNINYKIVGNVKFYDRKEVKDIMAYLKIIYNPKDNGSLKRIINTPRRGLGPKAISELELKAGEIPMSIANYLLSIDEHEEMNLKTGVQKFSKILKSIIAQSKEITVERMK